MKRFIIILTIQLLFTACGKLEPYDKIYYHNVGAEGYVYYEDKPVSGALICVSSHFESKGLTAKGPLHDFFTSDATGYFCVKFIRRTGHEDVKYYIISVCDDFLKYNGDSSMSPADIRNSKTNIQLGRINLKRECRK